MCRNAWDFFSYFYLSIYLSIYIHTYNICIHMDVHFACVCGHYFGTQVEPWDVDSVYQWLIYYYHKTPLKMNVNKRYKALHPGKIIDRKKVSSRPSARPDMRHRVATVLGNLLRQQLWVIVTSKFVRLHLTLTLTLTELTLNLFGHRLARCRIGVGIMPCGYTLADVLIFFLIPIRWQMEISCSFLHLFNNLSTYPLAIFEFMSCWYRWPVYLTIS